MYVCMYLFIYLSSCSLVWIPSLNSAAFQTVLDTSQYVFSGHYVSIRPMFASYATTVYEQSRKSLSTKICLATCWCTAADHSVADCMFGACILCVYPSIVLLIYLFSYQYDFIVCLFVFYFLCLCKKVMYQFIYLFIFSLASDVQEFI